MPVNFSASLLSKGKGRGVNILCHNDAVHDPATPRHTAPKVIAIDVAHRQHRLHHRTLSHCACQMLTSNYDEPLRRTPNFTHS